MAPLIFERMEFLDRDKNPYFEHAEAEYFIAERDGEPVGRITAQVESAGTSTRAARRDVRLLRDRRRPAVASGAARRRRRLGRDRGRERLLGPMDFTTNDEIGILIEGYERRPMILSPGTPPITRS